MYKKAGLGIRSFDFGANSSFFVKKWANERFILFFQKRAIRTKNQRENSQPRSRASWFEFPLGFVCETWWSVQLAIVGTRVQELDRRYFETVAK